MYEKFKIRQGYLKLNSTTYFCLFNFLDDVFSESAVLFKAFLFLNCNLSRF